MERKDEAVKRRILESILLKKKIDQKEMAQEWVKARERERAGNISWVTVYCTLTAL